MASPIFCFICDGSAKYVPMTVNAIRTLHAQSPSATIGVVLTPNLNFDAWSTKLQGLLQDVPGIVFKHGQKHFEKWNPTQHKLDIALFSDTYDPVCWLDSDVAILKDIVPFANEFYNSGKKFAFLSDHTNRDPNFLANWEDGPNCCFIPQACYMLFRSAIIKEFFGLWEKQWRDWIEPEPFKNHRDPAPYFSGSQFCIEQYALGQTLLKYVGSRFDEMVLVIERAYLFVDPSIVSQQAEQVDGQLQRMGLEGDTMNAHSGANASSYGYQVSSYGFPSSSFGFPTSSFGFPISSYGAGLTSYGAGLTSYGAGLTSYGAGLTSYGAGLTSYGAGLTSYGAGLTSYGAGLTSQGAGLTSYGAGLTSYGAGLTSARNAGEYLSLSGITQGVSSYPSSYLTSYPTSFPGEFPSSYPQSSTSAGQVSSFPPFDLEHITNIGQSETSPFGDASVYANQNQNFIVVNNGQSNQQQPVFGNNYMMLDLVQGQSVAHFYNAKYDEANKFFDKFGNQLVDSLEKNKKQN